MFCGLHLMTHRVYIHSNVVFLDNVYEIPRRLAGALRTFGH
jgi:hypothetical protein